MSDFWNNKFKGDEYLYGTEPNPFFQHFLQKQTPGKLLLPAEGEGRNALYAAKNGWDVTAFDNSSVARKKALTLIETNGLSITYTRHGVEKINEQYQHSTFDIVALCYFHLPPNARTKYHQAFMQRLKAGGYLYIIGFSKEQLKYDSGGPPNVDFLFDESTLRYDFENYTIRKLTTFDTTLSEGRGHKGKASLTEAIILK